MASLLAWPTSGPPLLQALSLGPTRSGPLALPVPSPPVRVHYSSQGVAQSSQAQQAVSDTNACNICKARPSTNRVLYKFPSTPLKASTTMSYLPKFFSSFGLPSPGVNLGATRAVVCPLLFLLYSKAPLPPNRPSSITHHHNRTLPVNDIVECKPEIRGSPSYESTGRSRYPSWGKFKRSILKL